MPYSAPEGKTIIAGHVNRLQPASILDIGPGAGTYGKMFAAGRYSTCIEIWEPYVSRFGLADIYDDVIVADAMAVDWPHADIVFLGDVLEHVLAVDGVRMWHKALAAADRAVILSLPIIHYPQGPWEGNTYETHLAHWSNELVLSWLPGITDSWTGIELGVYVAEKP